jgi:Cytochrome P450
MAAPVTATAAIGRAVAAASNATSANAILTRLCPHSAGQLIQQRQKLPSKWQAQSPSTIIKSILPETSSYTEGGPPVDRNWSASTTVQGMRNMLALTPSAPVRVCPTKISLPLKAMCPVKSSLVATSSSTEVIGEVRPYEDIPQPKGWPIVGTWVDAICKGVITRMHEYIDLRYQQLGPIYREKLGSIDAVFLFDPKDVENVFQKEGKNPRHIIPEAWIIHRDMTKKPRGLFFM